MSSREYEDGTVIVIARSVADDNCPEINGTLLSSLSSLSALLRRAWHHCQDANDCSGEGAGTVRAELLSSGYVITPRDEGGIHVAYILQIDFKGTPHLRE